MNRHKAHCHHEVIRQTISNLLAIEDALKPYVVNPNLISLVKSMMIIKKADRTGRRTRIRWNFPVISVPVFFRKRMTINIFLMEPREKLNLHGHPHAVGMINVISGQMTIRPFTLLAKEQSDIVRATKDISRNALLFEVLNEFVLTEDDEPWAFGTEAGNAHEIYCGDEPGALLELHYSVKDDLPNSNATIGWCFLRHAPVYVSCPHLGVKYITVLFEGAKWQDIRLLVPYSSKKGNGKEENDDGGEDADKEGEDDADKEGESDTDEDDADKEGESDAVKGGESDADKGEESDADEGGESDADEGGESDADKGGESDADKGGESDADKGEEDVADKGEDDADKEEDDTAEKDVGEEKEGDGN